MSCLVYPCHTTWVIKTRKWLLRTLMDLKARYAVWMRVSDPFGPCVSSPEHQASHELLWSPCICRTTSVNIVNIFKRFLLRTHSAYNMSHLCNQVKNVPSYDRNPTFIRSTITNMKKKSACKQLPLLNLGMDLNEYWYPNKWRPGNIIYKMMIFSCPLTFALERSIR